MFNDLLGGFETWIVKPLELIESGDRVVAIINNRFRPRGGASGEFEYRNGIVWTIRDGTVRSVVGYPTPEGALEAAGLEEQSVSEENMDLVRGLFAAFEGSPDEGELARRFGEANLARDSSTQRSSGSPSHSRCLRAAITADTAAFAASSPSPCLPRRSTASSSKRSSTPAIRSSP